MRLSPVSSAFLCGLDREAPASHSSNALNPFGTRHRQPSTSTSSTAFLSPSLHPFSSTTPSFPYFPLVKKTEAGDLFFLFFLLLITFSTLFFYIVLLSFCSACHSFYGTVTSKGSDRFNEPSYFLEISWK
jgi:hypothetical protein